MFLQFRVHHIWRRCYGWACSSGVEHLPFKQRVDGSRPSTLTMAVDTFLSYARVTYSRRTVVMYEHYLQLFVGVVGNLPTDSIFPVHADQYLVSRYAICNDKGIPKLSHATLSVELRTLKAAFNWMLRWDWITKNPFRYCHVRVTQTRPAHLSKEQLLTLLETIQEPWLRDVVLVAAATGMRRAEVMNLRWCDINIANSEIIVQSNETYRTKFGKMRSLPIHPVVRDVFMKRQFFAKGEKVFPEHSAPWVSKKFKGYIRKLGYGTVHFHTLRHSFATWLVDQNVPIYEVQKLLGHSDIKVTEVYAHLMDEKLRASVNKLDFRR